MDPYIYEIRKNLPSDICDSIIARFEKDARKCTNIKKSTDLFISELVEWKDIDDIIFKHLQYGIKEYFNHLKHCFKYICIPKTYRDGGYYIKKYEKGIGIFDWHEDFAIHRESDEYRHYIFIWYLNDVDKGGETEFIDTVVKPEKGKLVFFPATITYMHKGNVSLSSNKYTCGGWMMRPISSSISNFRSYD